MTVPIAKLRHRLALRQPLDIFNSAGGFARQWQTIADVWGHVAVADVTPRMEGARQEARVTHKIIIRWRPDVAGAMQFTGSAGEFRIHAVADADDRRSFMICYCEQVQS